MIHIIILISIITQLFKVIISLIIINSKTINKTKFKININMEIKIMHTILWSKGRWIGKWWDQYLNPKIMVLLCCPDSQASHGEEVIIFLPWSWLHTNLQVLWTTWNICKSLNNNICHHKTLESQIMSKWAKLHLTIHNLRTKL